MSNEPTAPLGRVAFGDDVTTIPGVAASAPRFAGFTPGMVIASRYRIVALLGRGGMGEVYRADDLRLGQPVALKFVSARTRDSDALERLYHEVRVGRQVSHPNVCRLHDIVETDGHRFIAMEYVDGEDLASLLRRVGRLPPEKALKIGREIAAGLAAAHDRGVIHRDLKPANIMIDGQGRARITDFGLASIGAGPDGIVAGTAAYMAPEQVIGEGVTLQSDVYALGLVLYEIFTGEPLYDAGSYVERRKERYRAARMPSSVVRDVDPAIDAAITACLAERPAERPASARALLKMLPGGDPIDAAVAAGETPSPEMVAAAAETGRLPPAVAVALFCGIVVALAGEAWYAQRFFYAVMRKPPEVLADRAADIVSRAGESTEARDEVYFFGQDLELQRSQFGVRPRAQVAALRPGIMRFIYRRSPSRLVPRQLTMPANQIFIVQSGRVTPTDPGMDTRGGAIVELDQFGGLVSYRAYPSGRGGPADWRSLLEATGIDMSTLAAVPPVETPPVASDARAAWKAEYHGQPEPVRIEAASLDGHPAWMHVYGPWNATDRATSVAPRNVLPGRAVEAVVQLALMLVSMAVAIVATVRNLRRGRGDARGALRLAVYVGGSLMLAWVVAAHHAPIGEDEGGMFAVGAGEAATSALILWTFYIALEPEVRSSWPRILIGWMRLLSGRVRDAMVGREMLLGVAAGIVGAALYSAGLGRWHDSSLALVKSLTLDPLAIFVGDRLISHVEAIEIPIGMIFVWLLARKACGSIAGPIVVLSLVAALAFANVGIALYVLLVLFVLLRSGLLTAVAMGCTTSLIYLSPLTLDTSAWFWPRAAFVLFLLGAMAAWSAWVATGASNPHILKFSHP